MSKIRTPKAKHGEFYVVPFAVDSMGHHEHRLYCHYRRRAIENYGAPTVESMQDISIATGLGTSTISRARKVLALAGWITVVPGRPDKVTVHESPLNVPIGDANVPIGDDNAAPKSDNVPQARTNVPIGDNSTYPGDELRDARVENKNKEKNISGAALPDAVEIASPIPPPEPPAKRNRKRDKPAKADPAPRPPDAMFDAIALGSFGIRDSAKVNGKGSRVGMIKAWVVKHYPGATDKTLTAFYAWFASKYPDTSAPRDPAKFAEHFVAFHDEVTAKRQKQQQADDKMAELSALYEYQQAINAAARQAAAAGKTS